MVAAFWLSGNVGGRRAVVVFLELLLSGKRSYLTFRGLPARLVAAGLCFCVAGAAFCAPQPVFPVAGAALGAPEAAFAWLEQHFDSCGLPAGAWSPLDCGCFSVEGAAFGAP